MAGGPKAQIKKALQGVGLELRRFDPDGSFAKRRQRLLESKRIDLVIDVGAHAGEYAGSLRHGGYGNQILSFEPQAQMFARLQGAASADPLWDCRRSAVGDAAGSTTLHVSGNDGFSSSIRPMATIHEEAAPESSYVDSETVSIVTLDEAVAETHEHSNRLMLKIDAQGYESEVLAGASAVVRASQIVELELGLVELYEGQALLTELVLQMSESGFVLADVEPAFRDSRTSQLLQLDGLFIRPGLFPA